MASDVQWAFAGGGTWNALSPEDAAALETAMKKAKSETKDTLPVRLGPKKTEYVIDFAKMEQQNPSTGKIRALKREVRGDPKGQPSQARSWRVGEAAECFSVSQAQWCRGEVSEVKKDCITVQYAAPNGSKIMKHLPPDHEHLRRPLPAATPATDPGVPVAKAVPIAAYPAVHGSPITATLVNPVPGRGFPQEAPAPTLEEVPFLGERQLADVQEETVLRLRRLIRHGDLRGAQRTLLRAKLLNAELRDDVLGQVKSLESEGEFALLLPA